MIPNDDLKRVTKDETQMFDALFKGVRYSIWLRRQSNIRIPSFVIPSKIFVLGGIVASKQVELSRLGYKTRMKH
jgi:hypothetical protein